MEINDLLDLKYFVTVYQTASFTEAAKRLNVSKVAVAKRMTSFETAFGSRLFRRSTRGISATPEADGLYGKALELLQHVQDFETSLSSKTQMEGTIRITCSNSMAIAVVGPLLVEFQRSFPGLKFDLISTDSVLDLIEHNVDLAIRMGNVRTNSLIGRKLGENDLILCATKTYLDRSPPISSLADLRKHAVFYMDYHGSACFSKSRKTLKEVVGEPPLTTNEGMLVKEIGLASLGVIVRSKWSVKRELADGRLVPVLPKVELESMGPIWLLSTSGRMQSTRVRAVFDMLVEKSKTLL